MVTMHYPAGRPARTVQRGGTIYRLQPGTDVDVAPADLGTLEAAGAHLPAAPPAPPDLDSMTVEELRHLARERDLPGRSSMTRDELLEALAHAPREE